MSGYVLVTFLATLKVSLIAALMVSPRVTLRTCNLGSFLGLGVLSKLFYEGV